MSENSSRNDNNVFFTVSLSQSLLSALCSLLPIMNGRVLCLLLPPLLLVNGEVGLHVFELKLWASSGLSGRLHVLLFQPNQAHLQFLLSPSSIDRGGRLNR